MKKTNYYFVLVTTILVLACSDCVSTGAYHAAGTRIGIKVGTPEVEILMIGYENIDSTIISDQSSAVVISTTKAGTDGLDTSKRTIINRSDDIKINELRKHDGSTDTTG